MTRYSDNVLAAIRTLEARGEDVHEHSIFEACERGKDHPASRQQVRLTLHHLGLLSPAVVRPEPEIVEETDAALALLREQGSTITLRSLAEAMGVSKGVARLRCFARGWFVGDGLIESAKALKQEEGAARRGAAEEAAKRLLARLEAGEKIEGVESSLIEALACEAGLPRWHLERLLPKLPPDFLDRFNPLLTPAPCAAPDMEAIPRDVDVRILRACVTGATTSQKQIAAALGCSRQNVHSRLAPLLEAGWLERAAPLGRGHTHYLRITEAGKVALARWDALLDGSAPVEGPLLRLPAFEPKEFKPARSAPTRLQCRVLEVLADGKPRSGTAVGEKVGVCTSAAFNHLRSCSVGGWVSRKRVAGGSWVFYTITPAGLEALAEARASLRVPVSRSDEREAYLEGARGRRATLNARVLEVVQEIEASGAVLDVLSIRRALEEQFGALPALRVASLLDAVGLLTPEIMRPTPELVRRLDDARAAILERGDAFTLRALSAELGVVYSTARYLVLSRGWSVGREVEAVRRARKGKRP